MDGIKSTQQFADSWWQFFDYCFNVNPASLICEPFWARFIGAFIFLGVVAVCVGCWKYVDYRRKYNAALRAQWLCEQVDESAIKEASWAGDKAYQAELSDEEVLARIREGVEQRKRDVATASPAPPA